MVGGLLGKLTGILDPRTVLVALLPTVAFWAGVAALAGTQVGWSETQSWWNGLDSFTQVVLAVLAVAGLVVFTLLLSALEGKLLTAFEGYWPTRGPAGLPRRIGLAVQRRRLNRLRPDTDPFDFEYRYRNFPPADQLMATRLGNVLKAAEAYPKDDSRYKLDAVFWWPRLIAVIPDSARADLSGARTSMSLLINVCSLSAALAVGALGAGIGLDRAGVPPFWGFWVAGGAAAVIAAVAHRALLGPARLYSDLLRAVFDLYRGDLLQKLGFALPDTLADERRLWENLGQLLYRGSTSEGGDELLDALRKKYIDSSADGGSGSH